MFCPKCGMSNSDDSKFCAGCGNPLQSAQTTEAQNEQPTYQPIYTAPEAQNEQPAYQPVYTASEAQTEQPAYQPVYTASATAQKNDVVAAVMNYQQPENAMVKAPFPAMILKISQIAIWLFYFISIFFAWITIKVTFWGQSMSESANLFKLIFDDYYSMGELEGGALLTIVGVLALLVIIAVIAVNVLNIVMPGKLHKIPQLVLCAAPAAITFLFMIIAWIALGGTFDEYKEWGANIYAGPGFGAWFVLILSLIESALYVVFMKDKDAPLFK